MADNTGILVYGEAAEGKLTALTTELLGCGRKLADALGQELSAVIVGSGVGALAKEAIAFGANKAYTVDDPLLKDYVTDSYVSVMEKVAKQVNPRIIIMGQTTTARDLAPRLAFRLGTAALLDCIELAIDSASKQLQMTRPVYGGNARAVFTSESYPQIVTVRAKTQTPLARDDSRQGEVINIPAGLDPAAIKVKLMEKVPEKITGMKLEDARVVISGGRGIGGKEGFDQLRELATALKGTIGASRPPCDNGWVSDGLQIGLTGKIVSPDLYVAIGISGSSQHLSGCSGAKTLVAINKDPEANIFRVAQYGVVGDWKVVLPAFTKKIKELTGS